METDGQGEGRREESWLEEAEELAVARSDLLRAREGAPNGFPDADADTDADADADVAAGAKKLSRDKDADNEGEGVASREKLAEGGAISSEGSPFPNVLSLDELAGAFIPWEEYGEGEGVVRLLLLACFPNEVGLDFTGVTGGSAVDDEATRGGKELSSSFTSTPDSRNSANI